MLRISTAQRLAAILWPEFVERDGAILPAFVKASPAPGEFETWTEYERFHSHTHIQDVFRCDVPDRHDAALGLHRPDAASASFSAAWAVAQQMGQMWLAKLRMDFPAYRFRVYVTKLDDPIVQFHRVRAGEPPWLSDEGTAAAVAREELRILDSRLNA